MVELFYLMFLIFLFVTVIRVSRMLPKIADPNDISGDIVGARKVPRKKKKIEGN